MNKQNAKTYLALTGGVGGAKLAVGLHYLLQGSVRFAVNTGDDFSLYGLHISPDMDTLMYTLADVCQPQQGWGRAHETWSFMQALNQFGERTWFQLGDQDLATHVLRTSWLNQELSLSQVTQHLSAALGIQSPILPMSNQPVKTQVHSQQGQWMDFQEYFVAQQCSPAIQGFRFVGQEHAQLNPAVQQTLQLDLAAIVICPSNPFVSIDPILAVADFKAQLMAHSSPVLAVTPIIGGQAIKGPTAKMMQELGMPTTALEVARYYQDLIDGFVLDHKDEHLVPGIEALGIHVQLAQTLMQSFEDKVALAQTCLEFANQMRTWKVSA